MQVWTKLFAKSPFKPLIKHAEVVLQTVEELEKAVQLWDEGNFEEMRKKAIEVDRLEDIADRIKEEIRNSLSSKLFMPVNRGDIIVYLHMQDKVADAAEDTAKWLLVKEPGELPPELKGQILKMAKESIKAAKLVYDAIVQLDRVLESGFSEAEIEKEYEIIKEIESVESKIDGIDTDIMRAVLSMEDIHWSTGFYLLNVARTLSNISDKAKDAAERIRLMMNK
ncbi:TIGR00153 family protein [Palaeococcus ferrophilus]|uniref:TIGR00153 family protein n=1 Tax=Palaeococcus ferrophilus TaxID=83868 RepID=UPI000650045B|nr:TIGR00153 family protein [Palaeococcus ferrophilus]